ncbi:unnamed protein product [Protopolystoma xenopodis]|uniref:Uncharacterized protein n=1 Tax=Protopolystoma xenopodis TaxID=117903 RepID=A0A448WDZ3_9PLAT|nr:unnamed protein product [Protopolystoma xenopodis]
MEPRRRDVATETAMEAAQARHRLQRGRKSASTEAAVTVTVAVAVAIGVGEEGKMRESRLEARERVYIDRAAEIGEKTPSGDGPGDEKTDARDVQQTRRSDDESGGRERLAGWQAAGRLAGRRQPIAREAGTRASRRRAASLARTGEQAVDTATPARLDGQAGEGVASRW